MGHDCGATTCFYCDMPLSSRHDHDHFPVPKELGGTATVPCCINCHDLKDRQANHICHLVGWAQLWPQLSPITRITLANAMTLVDRALALGEDELTRSLLAADSPCRASDT